MEGQVLFQIGRFDLFLLALPYTQSPIKMRKVLVFLSFFMCSLTVIAQETYTVDGNTYELKTEVSGTIDLLWNIIDGRYRYFVKKDAQIIELKNSKGADNKFQEEYKSTLSDLTQGSNFSTDKLNLTLFSLRSFIDDYNAQVDPNYSKESNDIKIESRLLFFGGVSNNPFIENPTNKTNPLFGAEIEFTEAINLPRHALFFQVKHVLSSDEFKYSITQFGVGYRFRIIRQRSFNIYANLTAATFGFTNNEFVIDDEVIEDSGSTFDAPFIFGVGADYRISDSSFITLTYDELFALLLDTEGNFSTHISIGYKIIL